MLYSCKFADRWESNLPNHVWTNLVRTYILNNATKTNEKGNDLVEDDSRFDIIYIWYLVSWVYLIYRINILQIGRLTCNSNPGRLTGNCNSGRLACNCNPGRLTCKWNPRGTLSIIQQITQNTTSKDADWRKTADFTILAWQCRYVTLRCYVTH